MRKIIKKIFGTANDRALTKLRPIVDEINQHYEKLHSLTNEELKNKTEEFRKGIKEIL